MEIKISCCKDCPFFQANELENPFYVSFCFHPNYTFREWESFEFDSDKVPEWCAFKANKTLTLDFEEK